MCSVVMCRSFVNYFSELLHSGEWLKYSTFWKWSTSFAELRTKRLFSRDLFLWNFSKDSLNFFLYFLKNVSKISPEFGKCYSLEGGVKGALEKKQKKKKKNKKKHYPTFLFQ